MNIPDQIMIAGLPFQQANKDKYLNAKNYSSTSTINNLEIVVNSGYPKERRHSYIFNEICYQLLYQAGWSDENVEAFKCNMAAVVYLLIRDNKITWVRDPNKPIPDRIAINGINYSISQDADSYLEAAGLLGEISYTDLTIKFKSTMHNTVKRWVLVHEIVHGILYEGNYRGDHNDDGIVKPLGTLVYLLLRDNDFYDDAETGEATTVKKEEDDQYYLCVDKKGGDGNVQEP